MRLTDTVACGCDCGCERPRDVEELVMMDAGAAYGPFVGDLRVWARERCVEAVREAREEVLETWRVRREAARRELEQMTDEQRRHTQGLPVSMSRGAWLGTSNVMEQEIERHEMDVEEWIQEVEPRV